MQYRQGDVLITKISDDPKHFEQCAKDNPQLVERERDELGRIVVMFGEATGHAHALHEDGVALLVEPGETTDEMNARFLAIIEGANLVHDEHDTLTLDPGVYEITRQREHTPGPINEATGRREQRTSYVYD